MGHSARMQTLPYLTILPARSKGLRCRVYSESYTSFKLVAVCRVRHSAVSLHHCSCKVRISFSLLCSNVTVRFITFLLCCLLFHRCNLLYLCTLRLIRKLRNPKGGTTALVGVTSSPIFFNLLVFRSFRVRFWRT